MRHRVGLYSVDITGRSSSRTNDSGRTDGVDLSLGCVIGSVDLVGFRSRQTGTSNGRQGMS